MFSENNSTGSNEIDEQLFSQKRERERCCQPLESEAEKDPLNTILMETVYSSSLKLLEKQVAGGNTEVALAYLKTYHFCQAIDLQILSLMLSKSNLSELGSICKLSLSSQSNNSDYLQNLEALIDVQGNNGASQLFQ